MPVSDYPRIPSKAPRGEALAWLCFTWPGIERVFLNPQEVRDKLSELKTPTASKHAVVISVSAGACVCVCLCVLHLFVCLEALITGVTGWSQGSLRHYWIYKKKKKENPAFVSLGDPTAALISLWWSSRRHGACGSYPDVAASKTSPCLVSVPLSCPGVSVKREMKFVHLRYVSEKPLTFLLVCWFVCLCVIVIESFNEEPFESFSQSSHKKCALLS